MRLSEKKILVDIVDKPDKRLDELINDSFILKSIKKDSVPHLINSISILKGEKNNNALKKIIKEL